MLTIETSDEDEPTPDVLLLQLRVRTKRMEIKLISTPEHSHLRAEVNKVIAQARRHKKQLSHERWIDWHSKLGSGMNHRAL